MKPIWNTVLETLNQKALYDQQHPPTAGQSSQVDVYRRSKIKAIQDLTNRPMMVYATACTAPKQIDRTILMIDPGDMTGFQTITEHIKGKKLDVLIHSAGGYPALP
jgi:2-C-methyl-D-erythritol 4-phosphate cytidylyltransferase